MNYPSDTKTFITDGRKTIVEIMYESGIAKTKNEARRLIKQGAVKWFALSKELDTSKIG